jgi:hypothetical protein
MGSRSEALSRGCGRHSLRRRLVPGSASTVTLFSGRSWTWNHALQPSDILPAGYRLERDCRARDSPPMVGTRPRFPLRREPQYRRDHPISAEGARSVSPALDWPHPRPGSGNASAARSGIAAQNVRSVIPSTATRPRHSAAQAERTIIASVIYLPNTVGDRIMS